MATLQDIRRRIRSVQSTQKITRAMKLVAAAKLRRAQERILEARAPTPSRWPSWSGLVRGLGEDKHPLLVRREGPRKLYVVVTADKGLCGAFNSNVVRRALELLRGSAEGTASLLTVGRKARDFFRRRPWPLRGERLGFLDRLTFADVRELAAELTAGVPRRRGRRGVARLQRVPLGRGPAGHRRAPPAHRAARRRRARGRGAGRATTSTSPIRSTILAALLPRHVEVQIYRALLESNAGEHGARMTAMEAASKNAQEMIGLLTIQYNKARQERITKELLDIVGGAEALRASAEG